MPEDLPKGQRKEPTSGVENVEDSCFGEMQSDEAMLASDFDLAAVSADADFSLGTPFPDGASVSGNTSDAPVTPGLAAISSVDAMAAMGASGVEGLPAGTDLFDLGAGAADSSVADLEGILQSLPGASHLPSGIVSSSGGLDFDAGLGKSVVAFVE